MKHTAAVADDQLPGLELAEAADRLGVAGEKDQRAEQEDAEAVRGERQGRDARDCSDYARNREIAAVLPATGNAGL